MFCIQIEKQKNFSYQSSALSVLITLLSPWEIFLIEMTKKFKIKYYMSYFTSFIEQIAGINSILEWNNLPLA